MALTTVPYHFPPEFWLDRADKARARAEQTEDPLARRTVELIAEAYEGLAERAKARQLSRSGGGTGSN